MGREDNGYCLTLGNSDDEWVSGERSLTRKLKDWKVAQPLTSSDDRVTVARKAPSSARCPSLW